MKSIRNVVGDRLQAERTPDAPTPGAWPVLVLALALLFTSALWWLPSGSPRQAAAFVVLWVLSAAAWFLWLDEGTVEGIATASGLGLLGNVVGALLLQMAPGPLPKWHLALMAVISVALPLALRLLRHRPRPGSANLEQGREKTTGTDEGARLARLAMLGGILLLATFLRLGNAGYKEFQGDEGVIMVRAAAVLQGDDTEIYLHEKGPVEILLPLLGWGLAGSSNELWARAPFLWAGWLSVVSLYALARRWFSGQAGLVAAFLFALNGFALAFARIAQYQSLVMLWTILALLWATRYGKRGRARDLLLVALFLAGALLAHYDAVLVLPAVAWLLFSRVALSGRPQWRAWLPALLAGAVLIALFYIPYVSNPSFAGTGRYLLQDRLGGSLFTWSGSEVWRMATFYNSTYYVAGLVALAAVGLWLGRRRPHYVPALLFAAVPALFYLFIVADPRTHVYTLFPGTIVLASAGAASLGRRISRPPIRALALALLAFYGAVAFVYVYLLFVDVTPERQRSWAQNRPALYPTTWEEPPLYGLFGFPHQAGWRLAPDLVQELPYASNEEAEITAWYMGRAPRTHCPDYGTFLLAENAQDEVPYEAEQLQERHLQHVVTVNGRPSLRIFGSTPVGEVERQEINGSQLWRTPQEVAPALPTFEHALGTNLGRKARLLGYEIEPAVVEAGGTLTVTLFWEALTPFRRNYQAFVHLYDGTMWAQDDGAPECDLNPTTRWEPGQVIRDPHILQLPPELPTGRSIPVLAGMYDLLTGDRLHEPGSGRDVVPLTSVRVAGERP